MQGLFWIWGTFLLLFFPAIASAEPPKPLSHEELLTEVQHRAFRFFWEKSDPLTGLVNDRASNRGEDDYTVASIASTGYALASFPIAVERGWIAKKAAYERALLTLRFLHTRMYHQHGWFYHFVDRRTGERVWNCEVSSIDTALLVIGAMVCGQYWKRTEVQRLANALYDRLDWQWMLTNGGAQPQKLVLSHGWRPEEGFLKNNWDHYCELLFLYLLGLGAKNAPLPEASWGAWRRTLVEYGGKKTLGGGPIFFHQMAHVYYDFRQKRDRLGWDYDVSAKAGVEINRQFCLDNPNRRKTYAPDIWGINANDAPDGYRAFAAPGEEDGSVSPTGAIATVFLTPEPALQAAQAMYTRYGDRIWGRYGFANAFNVERDWYGPDVIGIDLGMALLAIECHRTGLPWRLLASHPSTSRAYRRAGLRRTQEITRPLLSTPHP